VFGSFYFLIKDMSLHTKYLAVNSNHPFRRFVSLEALRRVLQGSSAERFELHVVLFENIEKLPLNVQDWSRLHVVDEHINNPEMLPKSKEMYYSALWLVVQPSPEQARRVFYASIDAEKNKSRDDELEAVKKRLAELDSKQTNQLWYAVGISVVTAGLSFGAWVVGMFVSGAWALGSAAVSGGIPLIANNIGLIGEVGAAGALNVVIENIIVPVFRDALAEMGYQNALSDEAWLDYMRTEAGGGLSDAELFDAYQMRTMPTMNERIDPAQIERSTSAFDRLMLERPSSDMPGQSLTYEAFTDEGISATVDALQARLGAGEELSATELRTLAELRFQQQWRHMDVIGEGYPEPLPAWNAGDGIEIAVGNRRGVIEIEDFDDPLDLEEDIFEDAIEGELGIAQEGFLMEAISTATLAELAGPVLGIVLGFGFVIWEQIQVADERNRVIALVDDRDQLYRWSLDDFERSLGTKITVPVIRTKLGDRWQARTFTWSAYDCFGPSVLKYLKWRQDNPEVIKPPVSDVVDQIGVLYRKLLTPGALLPQDWFPQSYTKQQYKLGMELKLNQINTDEHKYMDNMAQMQQHLATVNADAYSEGIKDIINQHKVKAKPVQRIPQHMELAWSDVVATGILSNVTEDSLFELFDNQQEAKDAVAQMSMSTHVIEQHLNSLQRFISTKILV
jgi:hypothetical protein